MYLVRFLMPAIQKLCYVRAEIIMHSPRFVRFPLFWHVHIYAVRHTLFIRKTRSGKELEELATLAEALKTELS